MPRQMPAVKSAKHVDAVGIGYIVVTASAYAAMDVTAKMAYGSGLNVATLLSFRFLGAGLLLLSLALAAGAKPRPSRRAIVVLFLLGAAGYALESFLLNSALDAMAVGPVILIFYAYPSIVAISAVAIGRDHLDRFKVSALVLSILGVATLLAFPNEGMNVRGIVLALSAAIAFAMYALFAEHLIGDTHKFVFSAIVMLGAGASIGVAGLGFGEIDVGLGGGSWGWIVLHLALISVAIVALMNAIARLGATRASIGNTLEPALAAAFGAILLEESFGVLQLAGGAMLLIAIALLPLAGGHPARAADVAIAE